MVALWSQSWCCLVPDVCSSLFSALQIGGGQTINANVLHVAVGVIKESRQLRLQPFNEYRKRFGMKPYKSFQELTGRAASAAPGALLGQGRCSVPMGEYEAMRCPSGTGLALQSSCSCPSQPCLLMAPQWGRLGWCRGCRGPSWGPEDSPGLQVRLAAVRESPSLNPLQGRSLLGVIFLLKHSDVHLVQERKRRQQSWKNCMVTLMLWSFTQACCSRNHNPMAFLGKAWSRSELHFP